jgi:hypothetical protein
LRAHKIKQDSGLANNLFSGCNQIGKPGGSKLAICFIGSTVADSEILFWKSGLQKSSCNCFAKVTCSEQSYGRVTEEPADKFKTHLLSSYSLLPGSILNKLYCALRINPTGWIVKGR